MPVESIAVDPGIFQRGANQAPSIRCWVQDLRNVGDKVPQKLKRNVKLLYKFGLGAYNLLINMVHFRNLTFSTVSRSLLWDDSGLGGFKIFGVDMTRILLKNFQNCPLSS